MQPSAEQFPWLRSLGAQLAEQPSPYFIAFSGGLDSTVLLHIACRIHCAERLTAVHINHNLSPNANAWEAQCRQSCQLLGCHFQSTQVNILQQGEGIEAAARAARYAVFERFLAGGGTLLMGHHADDQIETVLLNLLRGSGATGLAGIPAQRPLGAGNLYRPLLAIPRSELLAYAEAHRLPWVEDESNASLQFDRNFLRHRVVPTLHERFEHLASAITATTQAMHDASDILGAMAAHDIDLNQRQLTVAQLISLPMSRLRNALRMWFAKHVGEQLSRQGLHVLLNEVLLAKHDAHPFYQQSGWVVERSRGWLILREDVSHMAINWSAEWQLETPLQTPFGVLSAEPSDNGWQLPRRVQVRFRSGGERLNVMGRGCNKALKTLFKELDVPLWQRDRLPLLCLEDEVLCLADLLCAERCRPISGHRGWRLRWQPNQA